MEGAEPYHIDKDGYFVPLPPEDGLPIENDTLPLSQLIMNMSGRIWQVYGACHNQPELLRYFFPPSGQENPDSKVDREAAAKSICYGCVAMNKCLEYALSENINHGIWGGLTEEERHRIHGKR